MSVKMDAEPAVFEDDSLALQYVINTIINNKVNTVEVVRVVSVDEANNELTAIPVVKNVDAKGDAIEESNIYGVKFIRWQYGINAIIAVPQVGDIGLILVSKRDISKIDAGIVDSRRKFNLADSIYIGGLCGFNQTPTQYIKFDENGIEITTPTALTINTPTATVNAQTSATVIAGETATITAGTSATITAGESAIISAQSVVLGSSGGAMKSVALDGDVVYNSNQQPIGTIKASSMAVTAN